MRENWSGRQIGDFIVDERIARGGISSVYRAKQVSVNRYVALKILDLGDDLPDHERFRAAFEQEVATSASLEHIHILPVYGYGMIDDQHAYIAMRLLTGGSLSELLKRAPLSPDAVADLLTDVAQALDYAHRKGVLHGDLKPSNILLDDAGRAYISDFGVATVLTAELDPSISQSLLQLPLYVAPERLRGEPGDARSDIYSLGAVLYHLLTGQPPFQMDETGLGGLLYRQLEQDPPAPKSLNPDLSSALDGLIMRALRKNPADRFATTADLLQAFNAATGKTTLEWRTRSLALPRRRPLPRRLWVIPVIALLVMIAVGLLVITRPNYPTEQPPIVINAGERGTLASLVPKDDDIARARAILGERGFIAFLNCAMTDVLFASRARYARQFANEVGLRLEVYDSQNDLYTQLQQIEQARLAGARAFILCPSHSTGLRDAAATLQADNLPLAWVTLYGEAYGVKLDSDNYAIGQRVGELAARRFNEEHGGTYLIISREAFPSSQLRVDGMLQAIGANAPNALLIDLLRADNIDVRAGVEIAFAEWLATHDPPDAVLCVSDACAYGAINALQAAGVPPEEVFVIGAGGETFALDLLRADSYLQGTIYIDQATASRLLLDAVIHMLAGNAVPEILVFPPGATITPDNVNEFDPT